MAIDQSTLDWLAGVVERERSATPGPWELRTNQQQEQLAAYSGDRMMCGIPMSRFHPDRLMINAAAQSRGEFIAHARQDIPRLLALVAELAQDMLDECDHECTDVRQPCAYYADGRCRYLRVFEAVRGGGRDG